MKLNILIILGLLIVLVFSLFVQIRREEGFDQSTPTVIPQPIRSDYTCSSADESAYFDRYDNAGMNLIASSQRIPPSLRINTFTGSGTPTLDLLNLSLNNTKCLGGTDKTKDAYGNKIFIDTGVKALDDNGFPLYDNLLGYNRVDVYCCKGEMVGVPGTTGSNCLPPCPDGYTISSYDRSICLRNDSNCVYSADLSANITQSWLNTCAMIYKKNLDLTTTISSITNVVSNFKDQTRTVTNEYNSLNAKLSGKPDTDGTINRYFTNGVTPKFQTLTTLQSQINSHLDSLNSQKVTFDRMYADFGCSNYMYGT